MRGGCGGCLCARPRLRKVSGNFANALFLFRGFAYATWGGVCKLMYMPLRLKRVCASAVLVSIDW